MCVGNGILGNLIQVFPLWEGRKGKGGGNYSSQTKRKDTERNKSLHAVAADVAVGSSAAKRMHKMTDCALAHRSKGTWGTQLPGSLYSEMAAVRLSPVWVFTNDVQSVEFSTGGLQSTFRNSRRPAKFRSPKGHLNKQLIKMQLPDHRDC